MGLIEIPSKPLFDEDFEKDVHFFSKFYRNSKKDHINILWNNYSYTEHSTDVTTSIQDTNSGDLTAKIRCKKTILEIKLK